MKEELLAQIKIDAENLHTKIQANVILKNLTALELVYFKENSLDAVIHGVVNNLIENNKIQNQVRHLYTL